LIIVLESFFPRWREMSIHESSPGGASSDKLARECKQYQATHWFPDIPPGQTKNGFRCENLETQTFPDKSFDLVVTQDVFEHVFEAAKALREIRRTLKPGGAHVFTVPWYYWKETVVRAVRDGPGIRHLQEPDYHRNPIDTKGSLVVTEWGADFCDFVQQQCGMTTTAVRLCDRRRGVEAEFIEVFISRNPMAKINDAG
jgi:SAM-dependent methyltransferase